MKKSLVILGFASLVGSAFAQSFTEGFEGGPAGFFNGTGSTTNYGNAAGGETMGFGSGNWYAHNMSAPTPGTTGWFTNTAVFAAHGGVKQLNANFNSSTGSNAINNWFMSPVRTFSNGDTISFWARTVTTVSFPDRLHLKLSTSGASTAAGAFSTTLVSINPTLTTTGFPSTYTQFTATITGLGSPTSGRFAFHYDVTNAGPLGANSDFIGIDDVAYTAVPEPATMAALGLGALAMLRRRRSAK